MEQPVADDRKRALKKLWNRKWTLKQNPDMLSEYMRQAQKSYYRRKREIILEKRRIWNLRRKEQMLTEASKIEKYILN